MKVRCFLVTVLSIVGVGPALVPVVALAQTSEATISGVVSDPTGGALPGAAVTAIHGETGQRQTAVTNAEGFYALRSLPIGPYVIEAELAGFRKHRREGLTLTTGATVALDIQLPLGERTETVTVQAEAPLLGARTSEISQLIESIGGRHAARGSPLDEPDQDDRCGGLRGVRLGSEAELMSCRSAEAGSSFRRTGWERWRAAGRSACSARCSRARRSP